MKKSLSLTELIAEDSPYFCDSACLISLNNLLNIILKNTVNLDKEISLLKEEVADLSKEDAKLFYITTHTDDYIDYEGAVAILEKYESFFEHLALILSVLKVSNKMNLYCLVELNFSFLIKTLLESSSVLLEREDCPSSYKRVMHDISLCERKE